MIKIYHNDVINVKSDVLAWVLGGTWKYMMIVVES
jgi:hypothetical protein